MLQSTVEGRGQFSKAIIIIIIKPQKFSNFNYENSSGLVD